MNGSQQNPGYIFTPYSYLVSSAAINAGASNQQPLVLDQDADFELHQITGYADPASDAATDILPNRFTVQITDKNNSRIWSSAQIGILAYNRQEFLRRPVLLAKRSNLNFNFVNATAATNNVICTVVLHGYKVYVTKGSGPVMVQVPQAG